MSDEAITYQDTDDAVQMSGKDYARLSVAEVSQIIKLAMDGLTQRQIAGIIGCSQPTVCYVLKRARTPIEVIQGTLRAVAPDMVETLVDKARKSQDFRGAKEVLEMTYSELRPQAASGGGVGGVTIVIGQPGQPVGLPAIEVTTITPPKQPLSLVPRNDLEG
jgi:DNA-binding CsgD family transcriptional regulator